MNALLHQLKNDDLGFIVSGELILIATIGVLALLVGLSEVSNNINAELVDVANAFGSANGNGRYSQSSLGPSETIDEGQTMTGGGYGGGGNYASNNSAQGGGSGSGFSLTGGSSAPPSSYGGNYGNASANSSINLAAGGYIDPAVQDIACGNQTATRK